MTALRLTAFAAGSALLGAVLKKERAEFALLLQIAAACALVLSVLSAASTLWQSLRSMAAQSGLDAGYGKLLLRIICTSALGEWAAAFCKDAGFSALAAVTQAAAHVLLLSMCVPLLQTALQFAAGFLP